MNTTTPDNRPSASASGRFSRAVSFWVPECFALAVVVSAVLVVLSLVRRTTWGEMIYLDGDSLTLPIFVRALSSGVPMQWASSAYLAAFPELPLYALADLFTRSTQSALYLQAALHGVLIWLAFRFLLRHAAEQSRAHTNRISATVSTLIFFAMVIMEVPYADTSGLAIQNLFSTSYVGLPVVALAITGLAIRLVTRTEQREWVLFAVIFLLVGLSTFSNPMTAIVAVAPLLATVWMSWRRLHIALSRAGLFGATLIGASVLGLAARAPLSTIFSRGGSTYFAPQFALETFQLYGQAITADLAHLGSAVRLLFIYAVLMAAGRVTVETARRHSKDVATIAPVSAEHLIAWTVAWSFIIPVLFFGFTGTFAPRYYGYLFVTPLGWVAVRVAHYLDRDHVGRSSARRFRSRATRHVIAIGGSLVGLTAIATMGPVAIGAAEVPNDYRCVERAVAAREASGVSGFWDARPLDVYLNRPDVRILQVSQHFDVYRWLTDMGAYRNRDFGFVVSNDDRTSKRRHEMDTVRSEDLAVLGEASETIRCGTLTVSIYDPGTPGRASLNQLLADSFVKVMG
jgi:hypothetical protein